MNGNEHIVQPSGTIVKTVEWLASVGFPRAWYLHGRAGSAVIFQEDYHTHPRIAMQGDKLIFKEDDGPVPYIVITQPLDSDFPHEAEPGHTGMTCEKLFKDADGFGTTCGKPINHPVHQYGAQTGGVVRPSNMIDNGGSSDASTGPIDHASDDPAPAPGGVAPTDRERVYVAGPMTGLPEFNYPAFRTAAKALSDRGYEVEDPSTNNLPAGSEWADYMRVTIPQMLRCDGVALLSGWEASKGTKLEVYVASALDIPVMSVEEWLA